MAPPFKFSYPKKFFHQLQFSSHLFSLSFLYFFLLYPYNNFAVNFLGNLWLNTFSFSFCSCCLSSSASSLYFLSNSLTNSFTFSRFSLFFQMSSSTIYPFHLTKNFWRAVNAFVHLGQAYSLAIVQALRGFFTNHSDCSIYFWDCPSIAQWSLHFLAHEDATSTKIATGHHSATSLDALRSKNAAACLDA